MGDKKRVEVSRLALQKKYQICSIPLQWAWVDLVLMYDDLGRFDISDLWSEWRNHVSLGLVGYIIQNDTVLGELVRQESFNLTDGG
ncbi:unnamed protein product [Macrosiphum euphorbiae]|uniref:Uncharacterized protein n=1 Tax=Macrosiphum euphorbiae TaxID=13131 RepID=A0AAV0X977_9HEMI|nr:unnamed protein product [Macrosiphum euphorbiae]